MRIDEDGAEIAGPWNRSSGAFEVSRYSRRSGRERRKIFAVGPCLLWRSSKGRARRLRRGAPKQLRASASVQWPICFLDSRTPFPERRREAVAAVGRSTAVAEIVAGNGSKGRAATVSGGGRGGSPVQVSDEAAAEPESSGQRQAEATNISLAFHRPWALGTALPDRGPWADSRGSPGRRTGQL